MTPTRIRSFAPPARARVEASKTPLVTPATFRPVCWKNVRRFVWSISNSPTLTCSYATITSRQTVLETGCQIDTGRSPVNGLLLRSHSINFFRQSKAFGIFDIFILSGIQPSREWYRQSLNGKSHGRSVFGQQVRESFIRIVHQSHLGVAQQKCGMALQLVTNMAPSSLFFAAGQRRCFVSKRLDGLSVWEQKGGLLPATKLRGFRIRIARDNSC